MHWLPTWARLKRLIRPARSNMQHRRRLRQWELWTQKGIPGASKRRRARRLLSALPRGTIVSMATEDAGSLGQIVRQMTWSLRSEEHTSELQSRRDLVCRLLLEKKKKKKMKKQCKNE